jgi:transcriptional regulator
MSVERAYNYVKTNAKLIEDQSEYVNGKDWLYLDRRKARENEFDLHVKLLSLHLDAIKYVIAEALEDFKTEKKLLDFCKRISKDVEAFIERCNHYFEVEKWVDYAGDKEVEKPLEVDFQSKIVKVINNFRETLSEFNLNNEVNKNLKLPIQSNTILPLIMKDKIFNRYPEVKEYFDNKKQ